MSGIEWTDTTWNPVVGCTPVSPGCLNCYAATMARRLEAMGRPEYAPRTVGDGVPYGDRNTIRIAEVRGGRAVFTGDVRTVPDRLTDPLGWRKPRMVFVNSMSDLFHEAVPFEFIDRVFAVMALCPQHTFQVLTKRPERMAEYLDGVRDPLRRIMDAAYDVGNGNASERADAAERVKWTWPLPNVWLGTSVENQQAADERIPHLLRCPAAVRFLSCEPLLGTVDLTAIGEHDGRPVSCLTDHPCVDDEPGGNGIDWVIVGGESGANARPCPVDAICSVVGQCAAGGVPCFVKQMGARPWVDFYADEPLAEWSRERERCVWDSDGMGKVGGIEAVCKWHPRDGQPRAGAVIEVALRSRKGADPAEWPEDLRVRQWPRIRTCWEKVK